MTISACLPPGRRPINSIVHVNATNLFHPQVFPAAPPALEFPESQTTILHPTLIPTPAPPLIRHPTTPMLLQTRTSKLHNH